MRGCGVLLKLLKNVWIWPRCASQGEWFNIKYSFIHPFSFLFICNERQNKRTNLHRISLHLDPINFKINYVILQNMFLIGNNRYSLIFVHRYKYQKCIFHIKLSSALLWSILHGYVLRRACSEYMKFLVIASDSSKYTRNFFLPHNVKWSMISISLILLLLLLLI